MKVLEIFKKFGSMETFLNAFRTAYKIGCADFFSKGPEISTFDENFLGRCGCIRGEFKVSRKEFEFLFWRDFGRGFEKRRRRKGILKVFGGKHVMKLKKKFLDLFFWFKISEI